ncbi:WecB/TagA/CpsF family glycosyltransferase [Rhodococcus sp. GG48]|nr:WecB/TagA/CpsF family glycosyltransferase [Rhodococcus sp. GG48]
MAIEETGEALPLAWRAAQDLAKELYSVDPNTASVTWLNHSSVLRADWDSLAKIDYIGIDGTLLELVLRICGLPVRRTSADMFGPLLLKLAAGKRVALVGGAPGVARAAADRIGRDIVLALDGYRELDGMRTDPSVIVDAAPDVVVLGLGAGVQDRVLCELREHLPGAIIMTAGGWLDQLGKKEQYFPAWVHLLRMGWLLRVIREPRRLLRRYTIEALVFLKRAPGLVRILSSSHNLRPNGTALGPSAAVPGPAMTRHAETA